MENVKIIAGKVCVSVGEGGVELRGWIILIFFVLSVKLLTLRAK